MQRQFLRILAGVVLGASITRIYAFSLLGPYATWQTASIGYQYAGDAGGPMVINEGYRWPIPVVTYAYDATFLKYYGTDGVAAIESAIQVFNNLADANSMSDGLTEFALEQYRNNPTAQALGLIDVKTRAMGRILEQIYGAAAAERFVWTLRSQIPGPNAPSQIFTTVQRNYDPISLDPSAYVNNTLYTYTVEVVTTTPTWQTVNSSVDPLAPELTTLSGFTLTGGATLSAKSAIRRFTAGGYYSGLTRDDAGLVRFNLHNNNVNVETLFADVVAGTSVGSGSSGSSPWSLVTTVTNTSGVTGFLTNTTPRVVTALRPGVGRYKFVRVNYDSLVGATLSPYAINWQDRYVTNNAIKSQTVSRLVTHPDFLFSSGDYGVDTLSGQPTLLNYTDTAAWVNNSALNSDGANGGHFGPGVVSGLREIGFGYWGRYYVQFAPTGSGVTQPQTAGITFGYFDGTTNAPVVFPNGNSIRALENLVFNGQ